jgi:hypothetical protein
MVQPPVRSERGEAIQGDRGGQETFPSVAFVARCDFPRSPQQRSGNAEENEEMRLFERFPRMKTAFMGDDERKRKVSESLGGILSTILRQKASCSLIGVR